MENQKKILIIIFALIFFSLPIITQSKPSLLSIDKRSFELTQKNEKYYLSVYGRKDIEVPKIWLCPHHEVEKDRRGYVSSFNYSKPVTSFPIRNGLIGLHLSSWDYMEPGTGSAMAASGKDVFLLFNPKRLSVMQGILDLGITKGRCRWFGCFSAIFHNFLIGDVNNDNLTDIGITQEKMVCEERFDEENQVDYMFGPYYEKNPIRWYLFDINQWKYDPKYDGMLPSKNTLELPMIDMTKSPVQFVKELEILKELAIKGKSKGGAP